MQLFDEEKHWTGSKGVARQALHLEKCDDGCATAELNTVRSPFQARLQLLESCKA